MQFKDLLKRQSDVVYDASAPGEKPAPGKSIIVAEKEKTTRETIALEVMNLGYVPLLTGDGTRARDMAREYQPRLVLANLELEALGGAELLAALRSEPATRDVPVILISNSDRTPDQVVGSQVGADDYLCKPIDRNQVKTRIREVLLRRSAEAPVPPPAPPRVRPSAEAAAKEGAAAPSAPPAAPAPAWSVPSAAAGTKPGETEDAGDRIARAEQVYADCCTFARDVMSRARRMEPPDVDRCRELAIRLVQECERGNRLLLKAIRPYEPGETDHDPVNVAVFSLKIGHGLNYGPEELVALAMAGLCHDIGMTCVPAEVLAASGTYNRRQTAQIQEHPGHAYKILGRLGPQYAWLADAVHQEHERERGQGYPRGLKGDEISEFAKIIGVADTYESLSHRRSFRKAFIAFDALREIIGMCGKLFDTRIVRALVSEVSVFPLESYVLLNTGEIGRVVKTNPDNLLRPVVVLEYEAEGRRLKRPRLVDLAAKPLLCVTKPVDERELAKPA